MIFNILDNTTELWITKYIIGAIVSSGRATLYKNPSDQTVFENSKRNFNITIQKNWQILNPSFFKPDSSAPMPRSIRFARWEILIRSRWQQQKGGKLYLQQPAVVQRPEYTHFNDPGITWLTRPPKPDWTLGPHNIKGYELKTINIKARIVATNRYCKLFHGSNIVLLPVKGAKN